jgi:excisionase family DNA binding protein
MQAVTITQITPPELESLIENSIRKILSSKAPDYPQSVNDEMLTIQQAAQLLVLSVPTIYGLVSRSEIPCMKKGKRLYFGKQELIEWIKSGRKKTCIEISGEADVYLKAGKGKRK